MNQMNVTLMVLLIICWTLNPFLKKTLSNKIPAGEYMIYNHCICSILIVVYTLVLIYFHKYDITAFNGLTIRDGFVSLLGAITTIASSVFLIRLLQENDASYIMPHVQPCVMLLTMIIGLAFFNEELTMNKIIGTVLITGGLVFLNKS